MPRNINLPKTRVYVNKEAWGETDKELQEAWLVSVRALRGNPLCFQVWVDEYSACFDKIRPDHLFWKRVPDIQKIDKFSLSDVQMWECLSNDIELFHKSQLSDVPVAIRMGTKLVKGNYWFTVDCVPEKQSLGYLDIGDTDVLEEHKEMNVVKFENGQIGIYPNNCIKWIVPSLSTEDSVKKIPKWHVAESEKWNKDWVQPIESLFGNSDWSY